jgi:hypothetical protein
MATIGSSALFTGGAGGGWNAIAELQWTDLDHCEVCLP